MKILASIFGFATILAILVVAATGVDLVTNRTSLGLLILGVVAIAFGILQLFGTKISARPILSFLSLAGGGYFVWRALDAGPTGLAVPDILLVITFFTIYLTIPKLSPNSFRLLIPGLSVLVLAHLGIAAYQASTDLTFYFWESNPTAEGKLSGFFGHYNPFAGFLNGSIFFFLSYLSLGKKPKWRILSGALALGMVVAVVASSSRGGFLGLAVGGLAWMSVLFLHLWLHKSKMAGPVLILTVIMTVIGSVGSVWAIQKITDKRTERTNEITGRNSASKVTDGGRITFQRMAFDVFQDSPAMGSGPRAFSYLSLNKWNTDDLWPGAGRPEFAHNEYLQTLADYGAIGLAIILLLLLLHLVIGLGDSIVPSPESDSSDEIEKNSVLWKIGAVGGLVAILAQCYFSFLLHLPSIMLLVAFQIAILARRPTPKPTRVGGRFEALLSVGFGIITLLVAWPLFQSFRLSRHADEQISRITSPLDAMLALDTLDSSAELNRDHSVHERSGRFAFNAAMRLGEKDDTENQLHFLKRARASFSAALELNPYSVNSLAWLPRVLDLLGEEEAAEKAHQEALEKAGSREVTLRPHFFAAQSNFNRGYKNLAKGENKEALGFFKLGLTRLAKRRSILEDYRELEETRKLRLTLEAWTSYLEGQFLAKEANRIWKDARPRNPELAHGFLLRAEERFLACKKIIEPLVPRWTRDVAKIRENLEIMKLGQIRPAEVSQTQIENIIGTPAPSAAPVKK